MWPLEVQPFFDNIWTQAHEADEPYGPGVFRHNVELQVRTLRAATTTIVISGGRIGPGLPRALFSHSPPFPHAQAMLSVLTAGPVGIADQIGLTNATLVRMMTASNGTLLQPDKPATPISAMFSPGASHESRSVDALFFFSLTRSLISSLLDQPRRSSRRAKCGRRIHPSAVQCGATLSPST